MMSQYVEFIVLSQCMAFQYEIFDSLHRMSLQSLLMTVALKHCVLLLKNTIQYLKDSTIMQMRHG